MAKANSSSFCSRVRAQTTCSRFAVDRLPHHITGSLHALAAIRRMIAAKAVFLWMSFTLLDFHVIGKRGSPVKASNWRVKNSTPPIGQRSKFMLLKCVVILPRLRQTKPMNGIESRPTWFGPYGSETLTSPAAALIVEVRGEIFAGTNFGIPIVRPYMVTSTIAGKPLAICPVSEERRLHAFGGQRLQDMLGIWRERTVIESQHDFLVVKRQSFAVLQSADARMLARIDYDRAAHAKCVRRALRRAGRSQTDDRSQEK